MNTAVAVGRTIRPTVRVSRDMRRAESLMLARRLLERAVPGEPGAVTLHHDHAGRPLISVNGDAGPSVSFSHLGRFSWAALSFDHRSVGIDAVSEDEFDDRYPVLRAFHSDEWESATRMFPRESAAAFLWSAKEAAVKAWGCGFTCLDPRDVRVAPIEGCEGVEEFDGVLWDAPTTAPGRHIPKIAGDCGPNPRGLLTKGPEPAVHPLGLSDATGRKTLVCRVSAPRRKSRGRLMCGDGIARVRCFPIEPETWLSVALATHGTGAGDT